MNSSRQLRGVELRYVLTMYLARHGRADIGELRRALSRYGFEFAGRPSKSISDALRWEMRYGDAERHRAEAG